MRSSFDRPRTEASEARSDAQRREDPASEARSDAQRREDLERPARALTAPLRGFLLVAAALATLGNGPSEPGVDKLLGSIQKRYDTVKDIRASFEQEARVASIGKTEKSSGQVAIQRPGRMRWEYSAPDRRVVALDGDVIRMYLPDEGQLHIAPLQQGAFPPTALEFLLGSGDLAKSFSAEPLREEGREDLGLRLKPKQDASFEHIDLWVARDGYQLRESVVVDLFGNRTAVRFSDVKENAGVDPKTFQVEVPEGTETIDLRTGR